MGSRPWCAFGVCALHTVTSWNAAIFQFRKQFMDHEVIIFPPDILSIVLRRNCFPMLHARIHHTCTDCRIASLPEWFKSTTVFIFHTARPRTVYEYDKRFMIFFYSKLVTQPSTELVYLLVTDCRGKGGKICSQVFVVDRGTTVSERRVFFEQDWCRGL